jgi:hypothetical protein
LPLAAVWGAMNEPARMTSAAHAKKRAIGLPMKDAFQTNGIAVNSFRATDLLATASEFNKGFC